MCFDRQSPSVLPGVPSLVLCLPSKWHRQLTHPGWSHAAGTMCSRRPCRRCDVPLSTVPGLSNPDMPGLGQGSFLQLGDLYEIIPTPVNQLQLNMGIPAQDWGATAPSPGLASPCPLAESMAQGGCCKAALDPGAWGQQLPKSQCCSLQGTLARRLSVRSTARHPRAS